MTKFRSRIVAALGIAMAVGMLAATPADARRGGSFGSRGSRTYSAPRQTQTAPGYVPPVQRSMTSPGSAPGGAYAPRPGAPGYAGSPSGFGGSRFGGFGGGMLGGLLAGGLIGSMMGHGFGGGWGGGGLGMGGGAGMIGGLIQLALLFFVGSWLVRRFLRPRAAQVSQWDNPQAAFGGGGGGGLGGLGFGGLGGGGLGGGAAPGAQPYVPTSGPAWEIPITPEDQAAFETLLKQVQDAFGREDYGALREHTTPEVMSYLAEELSDNATHGRRNEVTETRLLKADVGEAWREGDIDYATAAMRYESIDLMRDRTSGAVLTGEPGKATETTELWTFAREGGGTWKLSAIQQG